jgi:hydroxyacylglutathione hydrolase
MSRKDLFQLGAMLAMVAAIALYSRGSQVTQVSTSEAKALWDAGAVVIDVREADDSRAAHVPGAILIPLEALTANLPRIAAFRDSPVIVYCNGGAGRGPQATELLNKNGFSRAVNLDSGFQGWQKAGLPTQAG